MTKFETLKAAQEYLKDKPEVVFDPYPHYDERIFDVLGILKSDTNYLLHFEKIENKPIEEMSLGNIATMYTFILRGERFCDGHIASFVEDGRLLRLVERHMELLGKKSKRRVK